MQRPENHWLKNHRAGCNSALPGKIDDFEAVCEWQLSCHGSFDEVNPRRLAEENERKWTQKGDFAGQMSFAIGS
jgi:hypothetical protein